ncbi:short-subunit dehydrogenase [Arcanobacterium wilhelmae]|uniref:Short-subunit dehydrogenase n=1 Tax=Arcanobacterium wilhelmae TaxID=1803177 RepID=A0ABT9ND90_9ACTO|nr:SDR family NAD(P)-dependent oxidoreductase [Arcanobacterium wilhelmae]MDP9801156.1 short-subunit dehydrogenase [Arcanobacterium wilhelmae]WFN90508.1 SDR family NAD(P)-dependent oxidoreductase [Arcanobacterium wilhelmae]
MENFRGKRALITGGTSGLGLEFARQLARRGLDIVLVARNVARLEEARGEIEALGSTVETLSADLSTPDGVRAVSARLAGDPEIDFFVNNAGAGLYTRLAQADFSQFREGLQVMALAPMELGGVAAARMKERGRGVIVNTVSMAAVAPMGSYSTVKGALKIWSDSLAIELQGSGVQVVTFMPGWVHTEFHARTGVSNSSIPGFLWMDAPAVVAAALADVDSGRSLSIPSKRYKVLGFLAQHAPRALVAKAVRKLNKGRR